MKMYTIFLVLKLVRCLPASSSAPEPGGKKKKNLIEQFGACHRKW